MQAQEAIATFNDRVQEKVGQGLTRRRAISLVVRQDPALHEAYLRATNSQCQSVQNGIGDSFTYAKEVEGRQRR